MLVRLLFAAIAGLAFIEPSLAANVTAAEVVEYGVFDKVSSIGQRKADSVLSGRIDQVPKVKLKEQASTIVAALGTSFGVSVKLIGSPDGEMVDCSIRWIHPKLTNPDSSQVSEREEYPSRRRIGEVAPTGYTFEHLWELVPGTWTIQIIYASKVLAEKTFTVVLPH